MYSFLRRPAWILSHLLVAALVVVMVSLGLWQRARYYEEKDKKDHLLAAAAATPVPLTEIVPAGTTFGAVPADAPYARVEVTGEYDAKNEILIDNRSLDGAPGAWVLTPLVRGDGSAVAVVRGWVPLALAEKGAPVGETSPPVGPVSVTGIVQLTQERQSFGPVDPPTGRLDHLARVDLARLGKQLPYPIEPVWVLLDSQAPAQPGNLPATVSLQPNDPSQNFSYMIQWWIFATIAVVGYPLILRAVARNRSSGGTRRRRREDDEIPWAPGLDPDGPNDGPAAAGPANGSDLSSPADAGTEDSWSVDR